MSVSEWRSHCGKLNSKEPHEAKSYLFNALAMLSETTPKLVIAEFSLSPCCPWFAVRVTGLGQVDTVIIAV
jgi:hypothetical protein